jgi:hypothetical protein
MQSQSQERRRPRWYQFERDPCLQDLNWNPGNALPGHRSVQGSREEAWAAPVLQLHGPGSRGSRPLPQPRPRAPRRPGPHLLRITPTTRPPPAATPFQTEKDLSPLNIQTFFVFIFFSGAK